MLINEPLTSDHIRLSIITPSPVRDRLRLKMPLVDFAGAGFFVPAPQWTEKDIPDLTGRVVVVTGANTGLGKLSARHMLQKGARVYAACRSAEKADEAIRQIKQETGKDDIHFLQLDLSDLHSCLEAGKKLAQQETRLDIALLSAGVMTPPKGSKTAQGLELQFGTNVVGHYAFVRELEPLLIKTASESATASVRVVWLSSVAHDQMSPRDGIHFDTIEKVTACSPEMYYGMSKLADIHMANSMAKRLEQHGILVSSVNPGVIRTDLQRHMHGVRGWLVVGFEFFFALFSFCFSSMLIKLQPT